MHTVRPSLVVGSGNEVAINIHNLKLLLAISSNGTSQVTTGGCETDCNDSRLNNWDYLTLHSFRCGVERTVTVHFLLK
jgi:hypothetical protein